ncbi:MAG: hypothetical protein ACREIH_07425, partial [Nitrospiraceae bacterium]
FLERVLDMVEGLVGHFYACVNCVRREDAEEGVQYLYKKRPSRVPGTDADHQFRGNQGDFLEGKGEVGSGGWHMDNEKTANTALASQGLPAPAIFLGYLLGYTADDTSELRQDLELWNLTEDIPGHPKGSTVSRRTLEMAGFAVLQLAEKPLDTPVTPPRSSTPSVAIPIHTLPCPVSRCERGV